MIAALLYQTRLKTYERRNMELGFPSAKKNKTQNKTLLRTATNLYLNRHEGFCCPAHNFVMSHLQIVDNIEVV